MPGHIHTTLYTDSACPWAYSEIPALRVVDWRYGDQLDWRLVMIGLTESAQQYIDRGYTPLRSARGHAAFRRYGMPFSPRPKARISATARGCRTVVAARLLEPRERVGGAARAAADAVHDAASAGRRRSDHAGGGRGHRPRRRDAARHARRTRGQRGVRARPGRDAVGGRERRRAAGEDGRHRRAGAVHGIVGDLRARRAAPGGGRVPAGRRLRRPDRQPRLHARPAPGAGGPRRAGGRIPRRPHHPGDRGAARPRERRPRPRGRRAGDARPGLRRPGRTHRAR